MLDVMPLFLGIFVTEQGEVLVIRMFELYGIKLLPRLKLDESYKEMLSFLIIHSHLDLFVTKNKFYSYETNFHFDLRSIGEVGNRSIRDTGKI